MFRMLKLNPPNGWRAVAWELAIVTAGVLIALAVQQWAEQRSWNDRRGDATEAFREEMKGHYFYAVEWRVAYPCMKAQLEQLERRLVASKDVNDPAPAYSIGGVDKTVLRFPLKDLVSSAWQSAVNDGLLIHFDQKTRTDLSVYYHIMGQLGPMAWMISGIRTDLKGLSRPVPLDASTRSVFLRSIDQFDDQARLMDQGFGEAIFLINKLGMTPDAGATRAEVERWGTIKFCKANDLPIRTYEVAMKGTSR